jgi:septum formation protein
MLGKLAGRQHQIYTAVAIIDDLNSSGMQRVERVDVVMRHFSNDEITHYLARGESLDKAGAYSIQGVGEKLIASIHGDYLAAVGMPLKPIAEYLYRRGISFPLDVDRLYAGKTFLNWSRF